MPPLDSLKEAFQSTTDQAQRWELSQAIAKGYGRVQADSALSWSQKGLELAQEIGDSNKLASSHYRLGVSHFVADALSESVEELLKARAIFIAIGDYAGQLDADFEMGRVYMYYGEYEKTRRAYEKFLRYHKAQGNGDNVIFALGELLVLYEQKSQPDSMLVYGKKLLEAAEFYGQTRNLAKIHNNLAAVYLYNEDFEKAKYHFRQAEAIGIDNDPLSRYYSLYALSSLFFELGQLDSAKHFSQLALEQAQSYGDLTKELDINRNLLRIYEREGDYKKAFEQQLQVNALVDSQRIVRQSDDVSELMVKYETQQKEAQIAKQELQLQKEVNRRNLVLFGSLGSLLLLGGVFRFFQLRSRQRQRQAEMELQLRQAEAKQLRELDQFKSNFFANISHEFRTPLTLILGPLREMYQGTFKGDPKPSQAMMIRNSERLLHLVNQLLDLSRLESGRVELEARPMDLTQLVRSIVYSFESWAMRKQIFFQPDFPKEVIPSRVDADKLEKILGNLLSNALKFTPEQGRVHFNMNLKEEGADTWSIAFTVSDSGPGIPTDQLPHIFDRFYSPPREEQGIPGSGIGLALTKELVELHNGSLEVESEIGKGSTFSVLMTFPKALLQELTEATEVPPPTLFLEEEDIPDTYRRTNSKKPVVLIIEDNADLRSYIKTHLQDDYQLIEANNGQKGLAFAEKYIPDLVLSDVMMPEMDGLTMCQTLKSEEVTSHIPVVLLTALAEQQDKLSGLSMGADAYLTKPFDPRELQLMVGNLIEQRRRLREKFASDMAMPRSQPVADFVSPTEAAFLEKIEQTVRDNLDNENFSIEDLGRAMGMSRSQLHRKVKAITDMSPSVYVRTYRLQQAYQLLEQRSGNISEIAFQVGIPNLAYFSRSFSEQFGFPPSELLQRN